MLRLILDIGFCSYVDSSVDSNSGKYRLLDRRIVVVLKTASHFPFCDYDARWLYKRLAEFKGKQLASAAQAISSLLSSQILWQLKGSM